MPTAQELESHRTALTGHCYRMMGSAADADDAVQETMVRAWKALGAFEERSSLRTWLYRIATRVCLDALEERGRRARPMELAPVGTIEDPLAPLPDERWIEPIPDAHAIPADADPGELASLRQSIRLAFVAALQNLPPKQRAALILTEVLGWSAAEVATCLETTVASVNSALQRARATLSSRDLSGPSAPLSTAQSALVERYVSAFERYDIPALTSLLHQEATLSMPPLSLWLRGHESIAGWLLGRGAACRDSRLIPVAACGSPAFGQYKPSPEGGWAPWSLIVLELDDEHVTGMVHFLDTQKWFPAFGLPPKL